MSEQGYYSTIPSSIIARRDLSPNAKLLYAVLSSLSKTDGYAWAGNAFLGECLGGVAERTVCRLVAELKKAGLVGCKGADSDPHRQIWLTDLARNGVVTPPKMASNNTTDNTKDKDSALSERAAPPGTADEASLIYNFETIKAGTGEIVERGMAECAPMPMEVGAWGMPLTEDRGMAKEERPPQVAPDINVGTKTLEDRLWAKFLAIQPDQRFPASTYAKERKGVKRLVGEALKRQPDDPEGWLGGYVAAWARLKRDRKSLIYGQPNAPAVMSSGAMMLRVIDEMAQAALSPDDGPSIPWGRV